MEFNGTFNNISVISWQSVLLVEETDVPGENHWPSARNINMFYNLNSMLSHLKYIYIVSLEMILSSIKYFLACCNHGYIMTDQSKLPTPCSQINLLGIKN